MARSPSLIGTRGGLSWFRTVYSDPKVAAAAAMASVLDDDVHDADWRTVRVPRTRRLKRHRRPFRRRFK
jgi:aspartate/tyrosine/aromatic aminotransferase